MDNDWIFEITDYREIVEKKLSLEGKNRGYRSELARMAGCQLAYISHVLAARAQFTPDQAAGMSEFWGFDDVQTEYFMTLVHLDRAATPRLSKRLEKRLEDLRLEYLNTRRSRLSHESYDPKRVVEYYLDWAVAAVHSCLMLAELQDEVAIAHRLGVEEARVRQALLLLQELGFVTRERKTWKVTTRFFHAADENKFAQLHHKNWRQKTIEQLNRPATQKESLHYTSIYTLSAEDFKKISALLQAAIKESRVIVAPSPEEQIACLAIDWYEV